jgi:hypothetical protein
MEIVEDNKLEVYFGKIKEYYGTTFVSIQAFDQDALPIASCIGNRVQFSDEIFEEILGPIGASVISSLNKFNKYTCEGEQRVNIIQNWEYVYIFSEINLTKELSYIIVLTLRNTKKDNMLKYAEEFTSQIKDIMENIASVEKINLETSEYEELKIPSFLEENVEDEIGLSKFAIQRINNVIGNSLRGTNLAHLNRLLINNELIDNDLRNNLKLINLGLKRLINNFRLKWK